ncbi:hypothetical protein FHX37_3759 [Haloactinospora alba]|uniref:Uncharacterized protein n=1 Tax=Haloactinospora alba TaxID=405555 RepID=A0A543N9A3_9ACTN|nr:hypothetical protein [Haloactinospora alba]TQN28415.1 hypothetical protein FHX37_3759 [Haloactinospora alba]
MLHRSITFIHATFLVFAVVLAFLTLRSADEFSVTDQSAYLWIRDSEGSASSAEVVAAVEELAREHRVNVGLDTPDLRDPGGKRHLYLAVGAPGSRSASWLDEGYPSFGRDVRTEVHPFEERANADPRGFYQVFGPQESIHALRDTLAELGLRGTVHEDPPGWFDRIAEDIFLACFTIVILCGVIAVGSGVLLNARSYGVLRLHGWSMRRILARDLAQLGRFWLPAFALTAAGTLAFLGFYNGFAQFRSFLDASLFFLGVFILVGLVTHTAALALVHRSGILQSLKGRVPSRLATVGAYAVRVPTMVLVLGVAGSVLSSAQAIEEQRDSRDAYEEIGNASHVLFSGSIGEQETMEAEAGAWLRRADADGEFVLAAREPAERFTPRESDRPDFPVLIVNDTYLEEQPVVSPSGQRYEAAAHGSNRVRLLIPESRREHEDDLVAGIPRWTDLQTRDSPDLNVDVEPLPTRSEQSVFTYGADTPSRTTGERPFLEDPVVVAVPNGSDVLHDVTYFSYATRESVIFNDPRDVLDATADPPMSAYVNGLRPAARDAAEEYQELVRDFRLEAFNLAAGTAVLLITGAALCIIHSRKNAQTIFARHISGWRFAATHRSLLAIEALLAVTFVGWVAWDTVTTRNELRDPATPPPPPGEQTTGAEPFLALGITALGLGLVVAVLTAFHRRVIREGASEG